MDALEYARLNGVYLSHHGRLYAAIICDEDLGHFAAVDRDPMKAVVDVMELHKEIWDDQPVTVH